MQQMQGRREKEPPSPSCWGTWEKNLVPFLVLKAAETVRSPQFLICMASDWEYDCSVKREELSSGFNFGKDINVYSSIQLNIAATISYKSGIVKSNSLSGRQFTN